MVVVKPGVHRHGRRTGGEDVGSDKIDQYLPDVYRFAVYMLRDHHVAQDVAQETMLRAWKRRRELRQVNRPKAWLLRVTANLCRDHVRRRKSSIFNTETLLIDPTDGGGEPWFAILQQESCESLEEMIQELSPRERSVLYLSAFEQLSNPEIANVLALTVGSVKVALSRARHSIRKAILQQRERENQT